MSQLNNERFIGKALSYNPYKRELTLKVDFVTPEKQEVLEQLLKGQEEFTFNFTKPFVRKKTYKQLKAYYSLVDQLLKKMEIFPNSENQKAMDYHLKTSLISCKFLELGDSKVPIVPSKADMTLDQMNYLIERVLETYGSLGINLSYE
jgi:hypothetical protein